MVTEKVKQEFGLRISSQETAGVISRVVGFLAFVITHIIGALAQTINIMGKSFGRKR